jgi:twinkle protein
LETYEKVILAFDNDEPGREALDAALELFSPGKAYVLDLGDHKDPNDVLVNAGATTLRQAVWEAKEYRPDGIVDLSELKDEILAPLQTGHRYPWPRLNEMLYGFRPQELVTWTAGTGVGKTAIVSELAYNMLVNDGLRVGLIYLEEGVIRSSRRLLGIHMNKPIHLPRQEFTEDEFEKSWQATLGTGRAFAYDHFGSVDSDILLNRIRHLVRGHGCDVVILDHISMVVSGSELDTDERRLLDRTMTNLRVLTQETGASIHVVSHLRRAPGSGSHEEGLQVQLSHLRGTQAIAQLSDAVIAAERDQQADEPEDRDLTTLRVLKNRYAGVTGEADFLRYDRVTGRLKLAPGKNNQVDFGVEGDY